MSATHRDHRGAVAKALAVLLALTLGALAAEGAVRVRQYLKHGTTGAIADIYAIDPASGLRVPKAGAVQGPIRINALGFRGPEIAVPKPPGTIRLAFLGGSTTFCAEVSGNEATWPHLVWQRLERAFPGLDFDYVNAAVPGYTLARSLERLRRHVAPLDPDVIVIYHATNDLAGNTRTLAAARGLVARGDDEEGWLARHSLLWNLVDKNLRIAMRARARDDDTGRLSFTEDEIIAPFARDLARLIAASRQTAELVAVATFAHRLRWQQGGEERRRAAVTALYYMPYMTIDGLLRGYDAYNATIRDVAPRAGALVIDGEDGIPGTAEFFVDSVHFTDAGSRRMAERVAAALLGSEAFLRLVGPEGRAGP